MTKYSGGCHCKKVRYEAKVDLSQAIECNCSHCQIKGLLLTFIPATDFELVSGEESLREYRFYKKVIAHMYCADCGVQPFARAEKDGEETVAVNVRTIDNIDLDSVKRIPFDGRSL